MPFTFSGDWISQKKEYPPIKVYKEKRKGSYVTIIKNIPLEEKALEKCLSEIKRHLASGGTIKSGVVEIQGDKVEAVTIFLRAKGWKIL